MIRLLLCLALWAFMPISVGLISRWMQLDHVYPGMIVAASTGWVPSVLLAQILFRRKIR